MRRARCFNLSLSIAAFLLMFLSVASAWAQSGRRAPKAGTPQPTPAEQPAQPEPTPTQSKLPAQPSIHLVVVGYFSQALNLSFPFPEKVQRWVTKRLRDGAGLEVMDGGSANRSDAIKRARRETETFVVWVELDEQTFDSQTTTTGSRRYDRFHINYYIFSPVTGKAKTSGVVYLTQNSPTATIGGIRRVPACYPDARGQDDYMLLMASLEVADRLMSALNVPVPSVCP